MAGAGAGGAAGADTGGVAGAVWTASSPETFGEGVAPGSPEGGLPVCAAHSTAPHTNAQTIRIITPILILPSIPWNGEYT